jgi:hypothetical protein
LIIVSRSVIDDYFTQAVLALPQSRSVTDLTFAETTEQTRSWLHNMVQGMEAIGIPVRNAARPIRF